MNNNVQRNAFYSLNITNDNITTNKSYLSIESIPIPNISNTFAFDLWYYIDGLSTELISQDTGLAIGIEKNKLKLTHPEIGQIVIGTNVVKFTTKEWSNIFISYDGAKIYIALNGVLVHSKEVGSLKLLSEAPINIGKGLNGYIRSFRLYKKALFQDEYAKYLFQESYSNDMVDLIGFISFHQKRIEDLSPSKLVTKVYGDCAVLDCIHVYSSYSENGDGYATLNGSSNLNPGGFSSGKFSIYAKIYHRPSDRRIQTILSNGYNDMEDSISLNMIYVDYNSSKIKINLGTNELVLDDIYSAYNWIDVLVSYNGSTLSVFIDGVLKNSLSVVGFNKLSAGDVKIGNSFGSQNSTPSFPFDGYIATVAIFDKALLETDAMDFFENQPFIFEDGLKALFSFDNGLAADLVSSTKLTLTNNGSIIGVRTVPSLCTKPYKYRVTGSYKDMSDSDIWRSETIASTLNSYFVNCFNLSFHFENTNDNRFPLYFITYIYEKFHSSTLFAPVFSREIDLDTINDNSLIDNLVDVNGPGGIRLRKVDVSNALRSVNEIELNTIMTAGTTNTAENIAAGGTIAAQSAVSVAASTTSIDSSLAIFSMIVASSALNNILLGIMNEIKESRKYKPADYKDDSIYSIEILELHMQHEPSKFSESAVYCRNWEGTVKPPEVVRNKKSKYAVYIASELKQVKIKAKFNLVVSSPQPKPSYDVEISGYSKDKKITFFNHLYGSGSFPPGINEIELSTTELIGKRTDNVFKYDNTFMWNYIVDGSDGTDVDTDFKIYSLPCIPAHPIYMDDSMPENYIILEYLDLLAQTPNPKDTSSSYDEQISLTPAQIADWLYSDQRIRYNINSNLPYERLCQCQYNVIFNRNLFIRDLNLGPFPIEVDCFGYASILKYFFNIFGYPYCNILSIANPGLHTGVGLFLNSENLRPAGHTVNMGPGVQFSRHAVVGFPTPNGNWEIYDSSLRFFDHYGQVNFSGMLLSKNRVTTKVINEDVDSYVFYLLQQQSDWTIDRIVNVIEI